MASSSKVKRWGIYGPSGSGKTHALEYILIRRKRVIVFDPMEEFTGLCDHVVSRIDDIPQIIAANPKGYKICYVPPAAPQKQQKALSALSKLLMRVQQQFHQSKGSKGTAITLMVDELSDSYPVRGGDEKTPGFTEACKKGRHYGIEIIGAAQRIATVSTSFRGNCPITISFKPQSKVDFVAASEAMMTNIKNLQELNPYHFLYIETGMDQAEVGTLPASIKSSKTVNFPMYSI